MLKQSIRKVAATAAALACTVSVAQESGGGVIGINPSPSPDARQIVFTADFSSPDSQLHLWTANIDGTGLRRLKTSPYAKVDEEPSWSSTGMIAFSSSDGSHSDIWMVAPDGSRLTQLTSGSLNNRFPVWSPDGSKIAFVSDRNGSNDVWVMNADGTGQRRLTTLGGEENHPSFSPDGNAIVFSETAGDKANLMLVNTDGTGVRSLTSGAFKDWNPSWGPNGILFSSNRDTSSEHWKVWVIRPDGTGLRKFGDLMALDPVWTKDGTVLFSDEISGTGAVSTISQLNPSTGAKSIVVNQAGYYAGISIRPFRDPHNISLNSGGKIRVAILSTPSFNAITQVDTTKVGFGHTGNENSLSKCYPQSRDVNGDGRPDLICRFFIQRTGLRPTDTRATLVFSDVNGTLYQGSDTVRVVANGPDDPGDFNDTN